MKRLKTISLALLTMLLTVTAWAQVSNRIAKAEAEGEKLEVFEVNPSDGKTLPELNTISIRFTGEWALKNEASEFSGNVKNSEGNIVATIGSQMGTDFDRIVVYFRNIAGDEKITITEPGDYTVTIPAGQAGIYNGSEYNPDAIPGTENDEIVLHYTVGTPAATAPVMKSVTPSEPVAKASKVEVTFDQPVKLSLAASQMPVDIWDSNNLESVEAAASAYASVKEGDNTTVVYTIDPAIIAPGKYEFFIEDNSVVSLADETLGNQQIPVTFTVADLGETIEIVQQNKKEPLIFEENLGNITFKIPTGCTLASDKLTMTSDKGETVEVEAKIFMDEALLVYANVVTETGVWTLVIPADFVTNAAGVGNAEQTFTFNFQSNKINEDDTRKLEFEYAKLVNDETKEEIDLTSGKATVAVLGEGWTLHVRPNIMDAAQQINLTVSHYGLDEYGGEGTVVDKMIEMYGRPYSNGFVDTCIDKNENEYFKKLTGNIKLTEGIEYTFEFNAEDTRVAPYLRKDWGKVSYKVMGASKGYQYSTAELVKVSPDDEEEIVDPEQVVTLYFSEPVNCIKAESGYNQGMGVMGNCEKIVSNADRTEWYITIGESVLNDVTADITIIFAAVDDKGLRVKGNSGFEAKSVINVTWDCHLGCPPVTITPAKGTVDKLFTFEATANGTAIALGSGADKPYITTTSGVRVAEVDMDSEIRYTKDGKDITTLPAGDQISVKSKFNLNKEITAPGKYILHLPYAAFSLGTQFSGASSRTMDIEYIIEGDPVFDRISLKDGAQLSELSYMAIYANNDVEVKAGTRMSVRTDDGNIGSFDVVPASNNGVSILLVDFNKNGEPLKLEEGVEYRLSLAEDRVFLAGTQMAFPAVALKVYGAPAAGETVALTHAIAGHTSSVANVAKGSAASVTLTPAEGFKVEKVTFNDADVTADVKNNVFTTPALDKDSKVEATYVFDGKLFDGGSAVDAITDFNLIAYSENGQIVMKGLKEGMMVRLFTIDGAAMGTYTAAAGNDILRVDVAEGVYVLAVSFEGKTQAIKLQNK